MTRKFIIKNNIAEIGKLNKFVTEFLETSVSSEAEGMEIRLALEEAVVNVVNYAYPSTKEGDIEISAHAAGKDISFEICDNGVPFDPTGVEEIDITADVDDRPIGGLGIFLVKQIMDKVEYRRENNTNILTLSKSLS